MYYKTFIFFAVNLSMAITAYQLQIVPAQGDVRIVYVVRCKVYLVVYYLASPVQSFGQADFTQTANALCVSIPALFPCSTCIKALCKFAHNKTGALPRPARRRKRKRFLATAGILTLTDFQHDIQ